MAPPKSRLEQLGSIEKSPEVSVLIVGGGINGAGLFRELALQGVDVVLAEKSDFCSGASAAATRVIHGGLRYLENGELRLVYESLLERKRLLANAPHYVKPLPMTIPIFGRTSGTLNAVRAFLGGPNKPGVRGSLIVKAGLTLYDLLSSRSRALPAHRFRSKKDALAAHPGLDPAITCTATFHEAKVSFAERLGLELLLDAERHSDRAIALNYLRVAGAEREAVLLRDETTGQTYSIRPKVVVNATGAWADLTNKALHRDTELIGGTKGSHLVLDCQELLEATRGEMIYFANGDGRICIFYPFFGRVIAGATDIPVKDPDSAVCDEEEVEYILDSIRQVLPTVRLDRSHVVFRFCGVRPLPRSDAELPGLVTRDYSVPVIPPGGGVCFPILSIVGGKWTTFRALAETVTDRLLGELGVTRERGTRNLPIGGGKDFPANQEIWIDDLRRRSGLPRERVGILLERYGTGAKQVSEFLCIGVDKQFETVGSYTVRELEFIATREKVVRLEDVILRRTLLAMTGQVDRRVLEELAEALERPLGWTPNRTAEEIERTASLLARVHGVNEALVNP